MCLEGRPPASLSLSLLDIVAISRPLTLSQVLCECKNHWLQRMTAIARSGLLLGVQAATTLSRAQICSAHRATCSGKVFKTEGTMATGPRESNLDLQSGF